MRKSTMKTLPVSLLLLCSAPLAMAENNTYGTSAGASLTSGDNNVLLGTSAGASITTGSSHVTVGENAGAGITSSSSDVVIGRDAGATKSFSSSVLVGTRAGTAFDGYYVSLLGYEAGYSLSDQTRQTFIGSGAGYSDNSTGYSRNTYIGYHAGYYVSDNYNTAVGSEALNGNASTVNPAYSVAMGYRAAYGVGSNDGNVAIGEGAGYDLGDGGYNTLIGARAGELVQDNYNTANYSEYYATTMVGALVGLDTQSGAKSNSFMGAAAGTANQTGDYNVVVGAFADFTDWSVLSDSEIETIFESDIGTSTGLTALKSDAQWSTLVGAYGQLGGDRTTAFGYGAKALADKSLAIGSGASASHAQSITIGYGASSHSDYGVVLGNDSTAAWHPHSDAVTALGNSSYRLTNLYSRSLTTLADADSDLAVTLSADDAADAGDSWQLAVADGGDLSILNDISGSATTLLTLSNAGNLTATGDVNVLSDANYKKNIDAVGNALWLVKQLQAKRYYWKPEAGRDDRQHSGLIAQEVEQVLPEVVRAESTSDPAGFKSVNYPALLPLLAQASGELDRQQQHQQQQLKTLNDRLDAIEAALTGANAGQGE